MWELSKCVKSRKQALKRRTEGNVTSIFSLGLLACGDPGYSVVAIDLGLAVLGQNQGEQPIHFCEESHPSTSPAKQ